MCFSSLWNSHSYIYTVLTYFVRVIKSLYAKGKFFIPIFLYRFKKWVVNFLTLKIVSTETHLRKSSIFCMFLNLIINLNKIILKKWLKLMWFLISRIFKEKLVFYLICLYLSTMYTAAENWAETWKWKTLENIFLYSQKASKKYCVIIFS